MNSADIDQLIAGNGLISDQIEPRELSVLLGELIKSLRVSGAVVEFGCYTGTTSLYISRLLGHYQDPREFHVYDSFEGLPEKSAEDRSPAGEQFQAGELRAGKKQFIQNYLRAHLPLPRIHKGWFDELTDEDVPQPIAFAFLDGDYYDSVTTSLHLIESKLAPHASIVVDDYANEALPGAARATDEWAKRKGYSVQANQSLGIIHT